MVTAGADVGATVEGTAVVDVGAEVGSADAAEFVAVALDSPSGALEQPAAPRPTTTRAETVTNLIFRISSPLRSRRRSINPAHGTCQAIETRRWRFALCTRQDAKRRRLVVADSLAGHGETGGRPPQQPIARRVESRIVGNPPDSLAAARGRSPSGVSRRTSLAPPQTPESTGNKVRRGSRGIPARLGPREHSAVQGRQTLIA